MRRSRLARPATVIVAAALSISPVALAADWTRWLGPDQNGASPEKDIFGKADPTLSVTWSRPLGKAYSAIAIADGKVVTMFGDGEADWLTAMDASSGEEIWRYRIDDMFPKIGGADGGQLGMPIIDGGVVYGLAAKGQLIAVRLADGKKIWSVRIDKKLGAKQPHFGFTTTPLIVDDLLFVQTGGPDGHSLTGLNKKTGKALWSTGDEPVDYQSPVIVELAGREQIVAATNRSVSGLLAADGTVLWRVEHGLVERAGYSTPILLGPDTLPLTARNESAAFRVTKSGDGFSAKQVWRSTNLKQNFAAPVVHGNHIYGYDADFLACVDAASGERVWKTRSNAAGLVLVDGHLVIFDSDGSVIVAEASPDGYKERTRVKVAEKGGFTYPSFSDGAIFVRNLETIARIDVATATR